MLDWNEFKSGKLAVWCDTKEKAKEFVNECFKRNIKWHNEKSEYKINWDDCKEDTCYSFDKASRCLQYGTEYFFTRWDYKIVKWDTQNMNNENTFSNIVDKEFINLFKTDCEKCLHKPVCKEIENWKKYCEEHIRLREKSILFDKEPKCPYYLEQKKGGVFDNMKSPKEPKYGIRNAEFENGYKSVPCNELTDSINKESAVEHTKHYKFDNGSKIKTIPCDGNTRGKRAELPILYFDYEKCENKEELFEILMKALFK